MVAGMGLLMTNQFGNFPEKVYENEDTRLLCAESALKSVIGSLHNTYFVGNAPMANMVAESKENIPSSQSFKRFFFKSQVIGTNKIDINYAWVTKEELLEYFPEHTPSLIRCLLTSSSCCFVSL